MLHCKHLFGYFLPSNYLNNSNNVAFNIIIDCVRVKQSAKATASSFVRLKNLFIIFIWSLRSWRLWEFVLNVKNRDNYRLLSQAPLLFSHPLTRAREHCNLRQYMRWCEVRKVMCEKRTYKVRTTTKRKSVTCESKEWVRFQCNSQLFWLTFQTIKHD